MDGFSKLLTALAALVGAVAWPAAAVFLALLFKLELKSGIMKLQGLIDRVKKASLLGIALELDRVADAEDQGDASKSGKVTPLQVQTAARIAIEAKELSSQSLLTELDKLCMEYDSLRRTMTAGVSRTRAMTRVIVKMRSLAPSLVNFLDVYKNSGSAGSRLAAIAIMQMVPAVADLDWLEDRFSSEQPFLFYHAALALQNVANVLDSQDKKQKLIDVANRSLVRIKSFKGIPDRGTIEALEALINYSPQ